MKLIIPTSTFLLVKYVKASNIKSDFLLDSIDRLIESPINKSILSNYGCYCFKSDTDFFTGKGPGLDPLDKACKQLTNCYKCNANAYGQCDPISYQSTAKLNNNRLACQFENSNNVEDLCSSGFCQCDREFIDVVSRMDLSNLNSDFIDSSLGEDRNNKCEFTHHSFQVQSNPSNPSENNENQPMFKFGSGAPSAPSTGLHSMRPMPGDLGLADVDFDGTSNGFTQTDEDLDESNDTQDSDEDENDYIYSDMNQPTNTVFQKPTNTISNTDFISTLQQERSIGSNLLQAENLIIQVPIDNIQECCGDSPSWIPITFSENKECCGDKSYNTLLQVCCSEGQVGNTGSC